MDGEEFAVVDIVVLFCGVEGFGNIPAGSEIAIGVQLL